MYDNIYYNPEKFNLTTLAEIEYSSGYYEFDTRVVWRHNDTGVLYTARDSGCSCPAPFEDYCSIDSLEEFDYNQIRDEALSETVNGRGDGPLAVANFLRACRGD